MTALQAEKWHCDVSGGTVAVLNIPGSLERHRTFDIDVTLLVRVPTDQATAWHELRVELDGQQQWQRRCASHNPGQTDGLDYHLRIRLEPGRSLRIRAMAATRKSNVQRLCIDALEEL